MWYSQASLISKLLIPVLCLLFKSTICLYLEMCAPWPFLSFYLEACVSVWWCLMLFLLSLGTPVHIHWHCDWQVISSTWHMCLMLVWLTRSGICPVLCAASFTDLRSVNKDNRGLEWVVRWWHPLFSIFTCCFWGGRSRFIRWCRQMFTAHNQPH